MITIDQLYHTYTTKILSNNKATLEMDTHITVDGANVNYRVMSIEQPSDLDFELHKIFNCRINSRMRVELITSELPVALNKYNRISA